MTRTGECACEQGWDQIQTNLQEWSWAGEQALSSRQLNSRGFPLIFLRVIGETGKTWDSFCLPIKRGEETTRRQRTVSCPALLFITYLEHQFRIILTEIIYIPFFLFRCKLNKEATKRVFEGKCMQTIYLRYKHRAIV